ncbi:unnamed protein product [Aureobasidium uvarum]|uniref:N-acetyltransferase domain-containing protein n=1 Tax=Aureobasidium uvarum TaxID=2773716 RepID=A0A9N8KH78_9PEZI|nr:unnamed protein product [Aureobasidium uvarum]
MISYTVHEDVNIIDKKLQDIATLFSENYGIWSSAAQGKSKGQRIRSSPTRLRSDCLPEAPARSFLVQAKDGDLLLGHVLATRWIFQGMKMCWITQLCVCKAYRNQGLATKLLAKLSENNDDDGFGILTSHPFAISAALRALGDGLDQTKLCTISDRIRDIMASCPVNYVRTAELRGSLFDSDVDDGTVFCADTKFFVDHAEPDTALKTVQSKGIKWPFGRLPEGHEFLAFIERP